MCGIFGFTHWNQQTDRLFPLLAVAMEARGSSSWGVSNGADVFKKLGPITTTIEHCFRSWENKYGLIFHTRAPSSGTGRAVEDAHPFSFKKILDDDHKDFTVFKLITGIHNGYVSTHDTLKTKYPDRKDFSVDSQHIFKHICDDNDLSEIKGSGAIAWYETIFKKYKSNERIDVVNRRLFIARFDTDNLHLGRLDTGELVFASTKDSIEKAARLADTKINEYLTIESRTKYEIIPGKVSELQKLEEMKFGSGSTSWHGGMINGRYYPPGSTSPSNNTNNPSGMYLNRNNNPLPLVDDDTFFSCPGCDTRIDPTFRAVCDSCLDLWVEGYVTKTSQ